MTKPLLSVCLITYNQAQYIREAIDTILMQKTNFPWELVIADDCSTDGTRNIILEYKKKNPDLIKLILQKNNVGPERNWLDLITYPKSKYILYAEGDDYFTDASKLQKQVDFLEIHKDFSLCFHPVKVFFENEDEKNFIAPNVATNHQFTIKDLVKENFIYTNSLMYRRQKHYDIPSGIAPGDWYLHLYNAKFGKIGFINETMSVYRRHSGGLWWDSYDNIDAIWVKHGIGHLKLYVEILKLYGSDQNLRKLIYGHIYNAFDNFIDVDKKHKTKLLKTAIKRYPDETAIYIRHKKEELDDASKSSEKETTKLETELAQARQEITNLDQENSRIKSSKTWRLRRAVVNRSRKI